MLNPYAFYLLINIITGCVNLNILTLYNILHIRRAESFTTYLKAARNYYENYSKVLQKLSMFNCLFI